MIHKPIDHWTELLLKRKAEGERLLRERPIGRPRYQQWQSMVNDLLTNIGDVLPESQNRFLAPSNARRRTAYEEMVDGMTEADDEQERASIVSEQILVLDEFIQSLSEQPPFTETFRNDSTSRLSDLELFISHGGQDSEVAEALIDFLRAALNIPAEAIRCTSVNGYKLRIGDKIDEQLREDVLSAKVLIGIITPNSIESAYVIFELGARWGGEKGFTAGPCLRFEFKRFTWSATRHSCFKLFFTS
jgi:hypothetical protein